MSNFDLSVVIIVPFLSPATGKVPKGKPLKGERVSQTKTQQSRIFARFDILSTLKNPPHLWALPTIEGSSIGLSEILLPTFEL